MNEATTPPVAGKLVAVGRNVTVLPGVRAMGVAKAGPSAINIARTRQMNELLFVPAIGALTVLIASRVVSFMSVPFSVGSILRSFVDVGKLGTTPLPAVLVRVGLKSPNC